MTAIRMSGRSSGEQVRAARAARWRARARAVLALLPALAVGWLVSGAGGCNNRPPAGAICEWFCTCKGGHFCDKAQLDACERGSSREQEVADEVGCGKEYDSYMSCVSSASCDILMGECVDERDKYEACGALDQAACLPARDAVAPIIDKCGGSSVALYDDACTQWSLMLLECQAPCFKAAPCEAFDGKHPEESETVRACTLVCLDAD
jgi:hypothetical protein